MGGVAADVHCIGRDVGDGHEVGELAQDRHVVRLAPRPDRLLQRSARAACDAVGLRGSGCSGEQKGCEEG